MFILISQRTAYVMRISDFSSDVCSSDLLGSGVDFCWKVLGRLEFFQLRCFDRSSAPFHHAAAVLAPALAPAIGWRSPFDIYDVVPVVDTGMDQVRNADPFTLLVDGVGNGI